MFKIYYFSMLLFLKQRNIMALFIYLFIFGTPFPSFHSAFWVLKTSALASKFGDSKVHTSKLGLSVPQTMSQLSCLFRTSLSMPMPFK